MKNKDIIVRQENTNHSSQSSDKKTTYKLDGIRVKHRISGHFQSFASKSYLFRCVTRDSQQKVTTSTAPNNFHDLFSVVIPYFSDFVHPPLLEICRKLQLQLHNSPFSTANSFLQLQIHFYNCKFIFTTAEIVISYTLKYALLHLRYIGLDLSHSQ